MTGSIFDIEEFAVYDGPGVRTVIFLKGCPLRCRWCHNPEGLHFGPQRIISQNLCIRCGMCAQLCTSPERCTGCGRCEENCPVEAIQIAGKPMAAEEVVQKMKPNLPLLRINGGGITFSGGEPLMQPNFVLEICRLLPDVHKCIETSGYAEPEVFQRGIAAMDYVIMDVKLVDEGLHRKWTGVSNEKILQNLSWLKSCGKPFRIRVPLIPTVNDSFENLKATADKIAGSPFLDKVELLPYHKAAGAKYQSAGMSYDPGFPMDQSPAIHLEPFYALGMEVNVL